MNRSKGVPAPLSNRLPSPSEEMICQSVLLTTSATQTDPTSSDDEDYIDDGIDVVESVVAPRRQCRLFE